MARRLVQPGVRSVARCWSNTDWKCTDQKKITDGDKRLRQHLVL
jgi:hypothetical protein